MSEMLGNQYFLARKYGQAAKELEKALNSDEKNKGIRRKLIICHTQLGDVGRALEYFLGLVKEDIDFIINTSPIDDDCPCPELVFDMEKRLAENTGSVDFQTIMGILNLYCDLAASIHYFEEAQQLAPDQPSLKSVLTFLRSRRSREKG